MRIVTLPPRMSPEDSQRHDALIAGLVELQRAYQRAAEPFNDALVEINNRYHPRVILVPEEGDLTTIPESVKRALEGMDKEEE